MSGENGQQAQERRASRRAFLKGSLVAGSALAVGAPSLALAQEDAREGPAATPPGLGDGLGYVALYFTPQEMRFLAAACERLIPADEIGPGAVEAGVPAFLDRQMAGPFGYAATWYMQGPFYPGVPEQGWQVPRNPRQLYRDAIREIDRVLAESHGGNAFAELPPQRQDEVLKSLHHGQLELDGVDGTLFFRWLMTNTKEGYFADPMYGGNRNMGAWRMLGFPGARGEFGAWVQRTGKPYPLPPVSIRGLNPGAG